jgi:uncharacterized protein with ACT and thioredoxin-like domain
VGEKLGLKGAVEPVKKKYRQGILTYSGRILGTCVCNSCEKLRAPEIKFISTQSPVYKFISLWARN